MKLYTIRNIIIIPVVRYEQGTKAGEVGKLSQADLTWTAGSLPSQAGAGHSFHNYY